MKQIAIMREITYGVGDYGNVTLSFNTYISEGVAALQVLGVDDATRLIEAYGVGNIKYLDGKPCWVEVEGMRIKYVGPCVMR